jgi:phosphoribosylanthranilate isomerase
MTDRSYPQTKICGLTRPDQARACADLGADAIGLVFCEQSPRNVSLEQAAAISAGLPSGVAAVGVFVDPSIQALTRAVDACGLQGVQLHGRETPDRVAELRSILKVKIFKALFSAKSPGLDDAGRYDVSGYLVECGQGRLPGGNAATWDWSLAETIGRHHPLILAGGLAPDNVSQAISACLPDAVDASSGLESAPGVKDLAKVARFLAQVRQTATFFQAQKRQLRVVL